MKLSVPILCILCLTPSAGMAQPTTGSTRVFISPSGEPFRPSPQAPDGFEAWFARVDARHDGHIDRPEFKADAVQFFKRLDQNGDGVIDGFEVDAYEKSVAPELDIAGQGFASGGSATVRAVSLLSDPEPVSGADLDLNSRISMTEWLAATDRRFDLLDVKHQGYLTHDALKALLPKPGKEPKP
jgi:Ca2+-binding EF-hand superfamily protein